MKQETNPAGERGSKNNLPTNTITNSNQYNQDLQELKKQAGLKPYQNYIYGITVNKKILCPFHEEKKPSFNIYPQNGEYLCRCFGCNFGGDVINFIEKIEGIKTKDAIVKLKEFIGSNGKNPVKKSELLTMEQIKSYVIEGEYKYQRMHRYDGNPEYIKAIYRNNNGDKQGRYFHLADEKLNLWYWRCKSKHVLYNQKVLSDRLKDVVLYPEGEKDCETLTSLGYLSVTAGGLHDFKPEMTKEFKGRDIILFPDNHTEGYEAMKKISSYLIREADSVKIANIKTAWEKSFNEEMPEKADITDFISKYKKIKDKKLLKNIIDDIIRDAKIIGIPETFTVEKLMTTDFPEPRYIIPNIIPEGLTLFAGKPKMGKSFLGLNIASAVASGGRALGKIQVNRIEVLYLALEDTQRRLKKRLQTTLQGELPPQGFHYTTQWNNMANNGLVELDLWLHQHKNVKLVFIDTLAKIRGSVATNKQLYDADYEAMSAIKNIADKHSVAIIVIHHTRKADAEDVFDTISGSTGLSGAADTIIVLKRDRGKADAVLHITGRDIEEQELALKFDSTITSWILLGDADEYRLTPERQDILNVLKQSTEPMQPKDIALRLNKKSDAIRYLLLPLLEDNYIVKDKYGKYKINTPHSPHTPHTTNTPHSANSAQSMNESSQTVSSVSLPPHTFTGDKPRNNQGLKQSVSSVRGVSDDIEIYGEAEE